MLPDLVQQALKLLTHELDVLHRAMSDTIAGVVDSENKQESKYDTRGLEASYLAQGQAARFEVLQQEVEKTENLLATRRESLSERVQLGDLVLVSGEDEYAYLLLPGGAGIQLEYQGLEVTVLTPDSPLGHQLIGQNIGAFISDSDFISEIL